MKILILLSIMVATIAGQAYEEADGDERRYRDERLALARRGGDYEDADRGGGDYETRGSVHATSGNFITDPIFYAYLIGITALIFMKPWITERLSLRFSKEEMERTRSRYRRGWMHPPKLRHTGLFVTLFDIFLAVAFIYYIYNYRFPESLQDKQYFVAIVALFFTVCLLKQSWLWATFNYFKHTAGIVTGFLCSAALCCVIVALEVLLIIRSSWLPFGFMLPVLIFYCLAVTWNIKIAYVHFKPDGVDIML